VNYTLQRPGIRWMIRLADDTVMNFAKLGAFIAEKESQNDPLKEFVFKGHCVSWRGMRYAQGGSGFLLSRFACEVAAKHIISIAKETVVLEDVTLGVYMERSGFFPSQMSDGHFMGHTPKNLKFFLNGKSLESCEGTKRHAYLCGEIVSPLNAVVFFHAGFFKIRQGIDIAKKIFDAKPDVFWWSGPYDEVVLCRNFSVQI
jgi:hypothetical protein